ncbi:FecCD family ABC transporter permease [Paenibacillus tyrfis]|uniref:FecCD family ABC transporter permease n=1 Tax=Paenibacillus tyrfis TaxID=1501230 RepID=UPI000B593400|nr:iron ABC transporter permease [Paenibacillus tyrfis]
MVYSVQPLTETKVLRRRAGRIALVAAAGFVLLTVALLLSVAVGSTSMPISSVLASLFHEDGSRMHSIIRNIRIPRTVVTALAGANLAVAGALMQAVTRNPLASPGVFGINAGASAAVVFVTVTYPFVTGGYTVAAAFAGGAAATVVVFAMASAFKGAHMEVNLALTGVAIQAILSAATQALLIFNETKTDSVLFWLAGSVSGRKWEHVQTLLWWGIPALAVAFALGRSASILSLGEDMARGLGQRVWKTRSLITLVVILLAGVSVAVAGPIGFVGLIVPHIVRYLTGADYRAVIPLSALLGAVLLLLADLASRFVLFPYETPVGVVTALIGTPYFIYLARRRRKEGSDE